MGNRRSVEKALEHVGVKAAITRDPAALRDATRWCCPASARSRQVWRTCAGSGSTKCCESARRRARRCSASAWECNCCSTPPPNTTAEATPGLGLLAGHVRADRRRRPAGSAHRLERGALRASVAAHRRPAAARARRSTTCTRSWRIRLTPTDVIGTADYGERFATIVAPRQCVRHPVPSGEVLARRPAPARRVRRAGAGAAQSPSVHA